MALGFTGSYGRVAAFARDWRADRQGEQQTTGRGIFVPLFFRPGEAFQFDWSEDYEVLGSERTKLQVAYIKLSHSRAFLVRAYCCKLTRTSSMPIGMDSVCSAACWSRYLGQHEDGGRSRRPWQGAAGEYPLSRDDEPLRLRAGRTAMPGER